jgi:hypothetical protein
MNGADQQPSRVRHRQSVRWLHQRPDRPVVQSTSRRSSAHLLPANSSIHSALHLSRCSSSSSLTSWLVDDTIKWRICTEQHRCHQIKSSSGYASYDQLLNVHCRWPLFADRHLNNHNSRNKPRPNSRTRTWQSVSPFALLLLLVSVKCSVLSTAWFNIDIHRSVKQRLSRSKLQR